MKIKSAKIPLHMTNLPKLVEFLNSKEGLAFKNKVLSAMKESDWKPDSSNAGLNQIAKEFEKYFSEWDLIWFEFYRSKNPFVGHNVISHARNYTVNYNTRFHSVKTFDVSNWINNFFHELTHLVDQKSMYSFNHTDQKDTDSAPFVIGRLAEKIYREQYANN